MPLFIQYWEHQAVLALIVFAFIVMLEGSTYAGWEAVAVTETGMTVYVDPTTIDRDTYVVTMSVLHDYQIAEHLSSGSFLSFTSLQQYDCGEVRSRTIRAVLFTEHMGNGPVLYSGTANDTWQPVTPMSVNHALWQVACPAGKTTAVAKLLLG
jgi:hypothetical protein